MIQSNRSYFAAVEQRPVTGLPVHPVLASNRFEYLAPNKYAETRTIAARLASNESSVFPLLNLIREENRGIVVKY
ncbi:unnamed protein product [Orchesella dallaii]|uniref:Uncharacterized protein n=1 Tax=Orchesella dallaii TaxID=48710 RepID=A0ABP1RN31_9HEXA